MPASLKYALAAVLLLTATGAIAATLLPTPEAEPHRPVHGRVDDTASFAPSRAE